MNYSSAMFNSTESVLQHLFTPLFQNISFNSSCRLISLRPEKNQNSTSVNVICSYQHDSALPELHTQELYSELSHLTHGFTQLGNYTLEKDSLSVNGEHSLCFSIEHLQSFFSTLSKSVICFLTSCIHVLRDFFQNFQKHPQ